jgi:hypothetical protein
MGRVEILQQQIQELSAEELAELRDWFLELDWKLWDAQLERDVRAGHLDALADQALRDHAAGKTTPL